MARADLTGTHVIITTQRDANRVHNKGHYGAPQSGGSLRLDLVEAVHLHETARIEVHLDDQQLTWAELLAEATRRQPGFPIPYLVYRDLRTRGYVLRPAPPREAKAGAHFLQWDRSADAGKQPPTAWVRAESERAPFDLEALADYVEAARAADAAPRLAVVDEESDLTHYALGAEPPKGITEPEPFPPLHGLLLEDRVLVADPAEAARLHQREFYGIPVATGLHLSLVEAIHLADRDVLHVVDAGTGRPLTAAALRRRGAKLEPHLDARVRVYDDLKRRGLVVKTGFKFGAHFRAYEAGPDEAHAPFLVQAVDPRYTSTWEPVARAVRLSHSVRKTFHYAIARRGHVDYLNLGRHRP